MLSKPEPRDGFACVQIWLGVLYGILPLMLLIAALSQHSDYYPLTAVAAVVCLMAIVALQLTLSFWPCPSCGKPYFGGWRVPAELRWFSRGKQVCANCGKRWQSAPQPPGRAA
jgi:hypothetical protein